MYKRQPLYNPAQSKGSVAAVNVYCESMDIDKYADFYISCKKAALGDVDEKAALENIKKKSLANRENILVCKDGDKPVGVVAVSYTHLKKNYEVCCKHGKPVVVMEPIKGGALVSLPDEAVEVFKAANPNMSLAEWALRYVESLDNVAVVLSGMSTICLLYTSRCVSKTGVAGGLP